MIVITGAGIVSAIGRGKAETLHALRTEQSGIGPMSILDTAHKQLPAGEVKLSDAALGAALGLESVAGMARTTLLGLTAVDEALQDCGDLSGCRVALVSGTTVGGMDLTERNYPDGDPVFLAEHYADCTTRAIAAHYGHTFSSALTISTACSAAANALIVGARMLEEGRADVVVAGGSEALSRYHLSGFRALMIVSDEPCRPFDAHRRGLNLGEGAAFVVMETAAHARRRHARATGVLSGWGNRCDAFHQTATSDHGEGPCLAITEALRKAKLQPADIDYINAHGTATANNDSSEMAALHRVFGPSLPPYSSTKAFTGHTTSASGSIEAVIALLALQHQFVPVNLHLSCPMDGEPMPAVSPVAARPLRHILSNAFAFGGNDSALIISRAPEEGAADGEAHEMPLPPQDFDLTEAAPLQAIDTRQYLHPLQARRMDALLREVMVRALHLLKSEGLERPGAIIVNTAFGCMDNTQRFLEAMLAQGEDTLSPTPFMQSTHNTIAAALAIATGCHGYNITYAALSGGAAIIEADARSLLARGEAQSVLLVEADRLTDRWRQLLMQYGGEALVAKEGVSVRLMKRRG